MERMMNDIMQKIRSEVTEIRWIDVDEDQLEFENPPVSYPCALVGFPDATFSDEGRQRQLGSATITVKLSFRVYESANMNTPQLYRDKSFEHHATVKKVISAIHGMEDTAEETYSPLIRKSMRRVPRQPDPKVYEIVFEAAYYDDQTGIPDNTTDMPDPEINFDIG